ncbi:hypothetical protein B566_EDAN019223, partial [Ephemera danica]
MLTLGQLEDVPVLRRYLAQVQAEFPTLAHQAPRRLLFECLRRLLSDQIYDVVAQTTRAIEALAPADAQAVRVAEQALAGCSPEMAQGLAELKRFLFANLYRHPQVLATTARGKEVVRELFAAYLAAPQQLPAEFRSETRLQRSEHASRLACEQELERAVKAEGQVLLGWRDVPVDRSMPMSPAVRAKEPVIRQIFIGRGPDVIVPDALERKLYVIRKTASAAIQALKLTHSREYYVPSMSCRTIIYKGLLLADQVGAYYRDLLDERVVTAFALVHQRFSTNTFPEWPLAHPYRMVAHNGEINTVKGNFNWMRAREGVMKSPVLGDDLKKLYPISFEHQSDTATFDNALELLADGQMKTGRDVVIGALLGADEFGFATAPLVAEGCIMMRKCHLNTCPVGVATQDPLLRQRFAGKPEHVVNYFFFVAEEVRSIMAQLGIRKFDELIGRCDLLDTRKGIAHWKAKGLDFARVFHQVAVPADVPRLHTEAQDHGLERALDVKLIEKCQPAIARGEKVQFMEGVRNVNRSVGAMLSGRRPWRAELRRLIGDANDYTGKGLSGGRVALRPSIEFRGDATKNIIIGNTALYGATSGEAFFRGVAGERFAVRLSGASAVVEGTGDHGCEYMTGGTVAVLGKTGRNFAAGMSGGVAFVFDEDGQFAKRCNTSMVALEKVLPTAEQAGTAAAWHMGQSDEALLKKMVEDHHSWTGSLRAREILDTWAESRARFVKPTARPALFAVEPPPPLSSEHLIEVDHVSFGYDASRLILNDVSLRFARG